MLLIFRLCYTLLVSLSEYSSQHIRASNVYYLATNRSTRIQHLWKGSESADHTDCNDYHRSILESWPNDVSTQSFHISGRQGNQHEESSLQEDFKLHHSPADSTIISGADFGILQYCRRLLSNRDMLLLWDNAHTAGDSLLLDKEA